MDAPTYRFKNPPAANAGPTIFVVDDDFSVRRSLTRLLRLEGMEPRVYSSAEDFLTAGTKRLQNPSCIVMDLHMPGLSGLELQRRLSTTTMADCPIIFISGDGNIPATVLAMRQGAVTFLPKPYDTEELLKAISEGLEKHRQKLDCYSREQAVARRMESLTEREHEVMQWVVTGALNKQIAAELSVVERTVKAHRAKVMEKMGVVSVAELVKLCALAPQLPPLRLPVPPA